jgi:uncharacterized protein YndB with AHSA1/START domain
MSTPDAPLRMELTFEMPGTPQQVWDALATANGISSWFLPTDLEEREGGTIVTHMGETESQGTVTGWEPPRRFAIEEPDWAALANHPDAAVTPMATEFLVEAQSGGTCVVRVVTSAFGSGADWEQEFFEEMEKDWRPFFDRLRLYLTHFPGQRVTPLEAARTVSGDAGAVMSAMRRDLGVSEVGETVETRGVTGQVERIGESDVLLRLTGPVPGFLGLAAWTIDEGSTSAVVHGQLFSDDAAAFVEREQPAWQEWLETLEVPAG